MGSRPGPDSPSATEDNEQFNVLVTGFGAFKEQFPVNPSWEIAASLPDFLPAANPKDASQRGRPAIPPVRIYVHPTPIRVSYPVVRALVPKLWECEATREDSDLDRAVKLRREVGHPPPSWGLGAQSLGSKCRTPDREQDGPPRGTRIDLVIHIGMAGSRLVYSLERLGHRDGYRMPDVDGKYLNDDVPEDPNNPASCPRDKEGWPFRGTPPELTTAFDAYDVRKRWKEILPRDIDARISTDPGRYLCDFIFFSSLAYLERKKEHRRVVFLHVPSDASAASLQKGRTVVLGLIRALVESYFEVGYDKR